MNTTIVRHVAIVVLIVTGCHVGTAAADAPARPNIVIILSDDMGYSDLGCYGGEMHTPNLDRLAAEGLRFTQFYNTARCCPTRAALLTGLYSHQAGVGHMTQDMGRDGYRGELNNHCATIAEVLRPAGYRTYMTGKWHVTKARHPKSLQEQHNWPLQRGFDRYYGTIAGSGNYFDPSSIVRDNREMTAASDPEYKPEHYYYTDAISDNSVRYLRDHLRDHRQQPFFLYVAYTAAHWPMQAPEEEVAKYKGKYDGGFEPIRRARWERAKTLGLIDSNSALSHQAGDWSKVANKEFEARCMEVYAAMIDRMDQGIGRIVNELKQGGQLENTLIFFLQDNGGCAENMGRDGEFQPRPEKPTFAVVAASALLPDNPKQTRDGYPIRQGYGVLPGPADTFVSYGRDWANVSNTPFREYKHWVHEGGIATPLVVHWPLRIKTQGELRQQPGHVIDLMATCLDVSGATYPTELRGNKLTPPEGKSLLPAFDNRPIEREAIYWEHEGNRAVRVGNWKLVAKGPQGQWQLYNLESDRTETHDLATAQPEQVAKMKSLWESWAHRTGVLPWIWKPAYK